MIALILLVVVYFVRKNTQKLITNITYFRRNIHRAKSVCPKNQRTLPNTNKKLKTTLLYLRELFLELRNYKATRDAILIIGMKKKICAWGGNWRILSFGQVRIQPVVLSLIYISDWSMKLNQQFMYG